jgi:hypothetical protein
MIELTLSENNMLSSLPQSGGVGNPAQLLPLLIGILTFIRVCFLLYVDRTGNFGEVWRFDANDEGQHDIAPRKATIRFFNVKLRGLMGPATPNTRANTGDFEENMAERHSPGRPWWKRHLVGLFPWMSVFQLWRYMSPNDIETSAVREKMLQTEKRQQNFKVTSSSTLSGAENSRRDDIRSL